MPLVKAIARVTINFKPKYLSRRSRAGSSGKNFLANHAFEFTISKKFFLTKPLWVAV